MPDWLTEAMTILTPILVALFGLVIARQNRNAEKRQAVEQQIQPDRIQVYRDVLEPFLIMFVPEAVWEREQKNNPEFQGKTKEEVVEEKMLSTRWVTQSINMSLIGSDAVVSSFVDLMTTARVSPLQQDTSDTSNNDLPVELMRQMAQFLLEIRRSTGNEGTNLRHWDMLRVVVSDLEPALTAAGGSVDERPKYGSKRRPASITKLARRARQ